MVVIHRHLPNAIRFGKIWIKAGDNRLEDAEFRQIKDDRSFRKQVEMRYLTIQQPKPKPVQTIEPYVPEGGWQPDSVQSSPQLVQEVTPEPHAPVITTYVPEGGWQSDSVLASPLSVPEVTPKPESKPVKGNKK